MVLLTNLWMGFLYMFIVCTDALQLIPADVEEAIRGTVHPLAVPRIVLLSTLRPIIATTFLLALAGVISEFILGSTFLTDRADRTSSSPSPVPAAAPRAGGPRRPRPVRS
ncbi:maltose ABC superfamily ATP-binding cassette transporter permease [Actinomyces sp. oral taxon 448]|uniref:maltose ABC superfamily ATP-binding cassette transporter permease n=1 Tax=Actinomyces sp. oral taxon 448 TaxID=712124 RepID=UPI00021897E3|nr:maltose ABC superfamily ATP-binding cassette transporter permease [Actinomyces sp. oral taxon 448]EGQ73807.1 maltose ABC superfamily ATP binding cassette transporter, permease protein [Actinomyces sp. oral taxon 448 str. F0400]